MAVQTPTGGTWRTIHGSRVFIKPGQTPAQAFAESGRGSGARTVPSRVGGRYEGKIRVLAKEPEEALERHVREYGFTDLRSVVAAAVPDASTFPDVTVVKRADGGLKVIASEGGNLMDRNLDLKNKVVYNANFYLAKQGTGKGAEIFAAQVENASAAGFVKMETHASRGNSANGYYTWARFGYDGDIDRKRTGTPPNYETKVSDLMKYAEGREWWKDRGVSTAMEFDLRPGSQSRRVLETYLAERKKV